MMELIVDSFAGGGGASTGIELATGRAVNIAINHDPAAILMHRTNHPLTRHYQESVWDVDPIKVCQGNPVGLLWASPDCKHFSKAKGAALVDRKIRGLAWIVLRWAGKVRPRVILLENVEEFVTWGPVRKGKPVKSKAGQTFEKWKTQLESLGYAIDYRTLVAADYGAPTTRKRFCLIARCDGKPIVWPEATHAPRDSEAVRAGKLKPWVSAAEIIDWNIPCPSIFDTKTEIKEKYGLPAVRPLAENTLRRVIRGVDKFTIKSGNPFIVPTGYGERTGQLPRVQDINDPLTTVVGSGKHAVVSPSLMSIGQTNGGNRIRDVREPVPTTVSKAEACIVAPSLIQYHTEQTENARAAGMEKPINTVDASNRYGLVAANLVEYYGNGNPLDAREPMHTATSHDREAVTTAHVVKFKGDNLGQDLREPLQTVTASAGKNRQYGGGTFAVCKVHLCRIRPEENFGHWPEIRALLNKYCGYQLTKNEILLLEICGTLYFISDIGLRMLTPRELYAAMGFPPDYIISHDYTGKPYPKSAQVARCGNAVCPPMAEAVVRANLPEWSSTIKIETMRQLAAIVAG